MITRWRILGAVLAVAATLGLRWMSTLPMATQTAPDAVLRLAWSARPERVETCREQTPEQLANLPAHMRQPLVCEGTTASYRLEVRYNGEVLAEQVVRGGGLRRDRRLYVFRELPVPPGDAEIAVTLDRVESASAGDESHGERAARAPAASAAVPAHLALTQRVHFSPRQVVLVTYDPEERELKALRPDSE